MFCVCMNACVCVCVKWTNLGEYLCAEVVCSACSHYSMHKCDFCGEFLCVACLR